MGVVEVEEEEEEENPSRQQQRQQDRRQQQQQQQWQQAAFPRCKRPWHFQARRVAAVVQLMRWWVSGRPVSPTA